MRRRTTPSARGRNRRILTPRALAAPPGSANAPSGDPVFAPEIKRRPLFLRIRIKGCPAILCPPPTLERCHETDWFVDKPIRTQNTRRTGRKEAGIRIRPRERLGAGFHHPAIQPARQGSLSHHGRRRYVI